jgi:hydroxymethylpyrimidine pyrophosphatase-like HAD family hydrolase
MTGVEIVDLTTEVSLNLCVQRDKQRVTRESGRVGRAVINNMALHAGLIRWDYDQLEGGKIVIVDIDGTVADLTHRLPFIKGPTKDWKTSNAMVKDDEPFKIVIEWVRQIYRSGHVVVFVSGRSTECAIETEEWLLKYGIPYDYLFMRNGGDYRDDTIVKQAILDRMPKDRIEFVIDDRPSVVEMWRANGIKVYPVHQDRWVPLAEEVLQ